MPKLVDLHNHALFGVDDGARTLEMTEAMLAISYAEGVRAICLTPHGDRHRFPCEAETVVKHFAAAEALCRQEFPGLILSLGHEVFGYHESASLLQGGHYLPLGQGNTVMVEFMPGIDFRDMCNLLRTYQTAGFAPLLAHAERYGCLLYDVDRVKELARMRVMIQVNATAVRRHPLLSTSGRFVHKLLEADLVDVVASDAHDTERRPPHLLAAYQTVERRYGAKRAERVFFETPQRLLLGKNRKEDL